MNHERREIVDVAWNTLNGSKDNKVDVIYLSKIKLIIPDRNLKKCF